MRAAKCFGWATVALGLTAGVALAEGKSVIVLDASGSMWGQIDGRAKLEIAREALGSVLQGIPAETELGLMAYGHREKGSCTDIEMVVPPAPGTAAAITEAANNMKFLGKTPLSEAVRQAAAELRSTEEKATVILITDGIETCNADPCALGLELEQSGVDFTAHVVGFGLTEDEGKAVACLAENTGGKYIEAKDSGSLVDALKTTVAAAPEPEPEPEKVALEENVDPVLRLAAGGDELTGDPLSDAYFDFLPLGADGSKGETVATIYGASKALVPAGTYIMRTTLHEAVVEQEVVIKDSALAMPEAVLDAGILSLTLLAEEGGQPASEAGWEMNGAGGVSDYGYAKTFRVFPAGEYELAMKLGELRAKEAVTITAGETLEKTVILGVGTAVFTAYYAEGVPVEGDQSFDVFEAKKALDGSRVNIRTDYGAGSDPQLAPGDYVVIGKVQEATAEVPFTLKPGQRLEVPVVLNAGIAAISAPNASSIEIFEGKAALDGSRKSLRVDYGDQSETTLPAGDYLAVARVDEVRAETTFSVKAAERTEAAITLSAGRAEVTAEGANEIVILPGKVGLDGKRQPLTNAYDQNLSVLLPPGDYVARGEAGKASAEAPFAIKDGEVTPVTVVIPRGAVAVSAPGAKEIAFIIKPGLDGKRENIGGDYGETSELILPPGDYLAVAEFGDDVRAETAFTLADGQRLELTLAKP